MTRLGIAAGEKRRRQMEFQPIRTFELALERIAESAVGVKPRHLVLIFVGHQLEQALRDRLGESAAPFGARRFRFRNFGDERTIALRISVILIADKKRCAMLDKRGERFGRRRRLHHRPHERLDAGRIVRSDAAPREGALRLIDGDAIELDCALQRVESNRHAALLERIAEHEEVSRDRIAHQRGCDSRAVDEFDVVRAGGRHDGLLHLRGLEIEVTVDDKRGSGLKITIDNCLCRPAGNSGERRRTCCDHHVAAEDEIGSADGDPYGVQPVLCGCEPHMAHHRAVFLRESGEVEHRTAFSFEVCGDAEQGA